jgi:F420-0:gamma-glutamyl ligase-like protein
MSGYKVLAVTTRYWRPGDDYLKEIVESVKGRVADFDFVIVSEKAISTASKGVVDESKVMSGRNAEFLARFWMRLVWGYLLGPMCHLRKKLLFQLRNYPISMGSRHKQVTLEQAGMLQALMFGSEGGIDGSNLPYSYVCLPLSNASEIAEKIRSMILATLKRQVSVLVVDTDRTYSFLNFHFTPRPKAVKGVHSFGGVFPYVIGRFFRLKNTATPLALAGSSLPTEEVLRIAELANRARGFGAGRTVWDMAEKFAVPLDNTSWEMLETVKHKPIVILRRRNR